MAEGNLRNHKVSAPENDDRGSPSHALSEFDKFRCELEIPNNKCAIAFRNLSTRQEMKISEMLQK